MRYIIFIKGEGRGHVTQGLALTRLLLSRGHEVCCLVVGTPQKNLQPSFLFTRSPAPVHEVYSPSFVTDPKNRGIHWSKTLLRGARDLPAYRSGLREIGRILRRHRPDVVINLYEPMLTLYSLIVRVNAPVVHISHQALMLHEAFHFPSDRRHERALVRNYTRFLRRSCAKTLALSFYELPDDTHRRIIPVPPLLREEVFQRTPTSGKHFLVYLLKDGLATDIEAFHARHPEVELHVFWSRANAPETLSVSETLTFHRLNDTLFLDLMASCRGVACTAGFETVCEAFYYGKPAILMPTPKQYEQYLNALDAERVGAGKRVEALDLEQLIAFLPQYHPDHDAYLQWLERGRAKLLFHLEHPRAEMPPSAVAL